MNTETINRSLLNFVDESPNSYFAVRNLSAMLDARGFHRLYESEIWAPGDLRRAYVIRGDSSLIAFRVPHGGVSGFQILAAHSDSPSFRVKPGAGLCAENRYVRLNVEGYGGMLCNTWFDRPLSVAGRVLVRTPEGAESRLVNLDRDLLIIPSLAIHMDRKANEGRELNLQRDMLPLLSLDGEKDGLDALLAESAGVEISALLDSDLFLYQRVKGCLLGKNKEFLSAGRLDDLQCAFAGMQGFLAAEPDRRAAVCCVLDNEEVGSATRQGAGSTFLRDVLRRLTETAGGGETDYLRALANSFLLSADNAHGVHPAFPEKSDPGNRPVLNGGVVLKYNAGQRYTTDALSGAVVRRLCERAEAPLQVFVNRSDMPGGSTLGCISSGRVSVCAADVGLAQLAMHSAYETAGAADTAYLAVLAETLFSTALTFDGTGGFRLDGSESRA